MSSIGSNNTEKGKYGENSAVSFLEENGYIIIQRNYRASRYEIDIIAIITLGNGEKAIHFCEVKYRKDEIFKKAYLSVNKEKQRHIIRAAELFLKSNSSLYGDLEVCFDVITVVETRLGNIIEHIEKAFYQA